MRWELRFIKIDGPVKILYLTPSINFKITIRRGVESNIWLSINIFITWNKIYKWDTSCIKSWKYGSSIY